MAGSPLFAGAPCAMALSRMRASGSRVELSGEGLPCGEGTAASPFMEQERGSFEPGAMQSGATPSDFAPRRFRPARTGRARGEYRPPSFGGPEPIIKVNRNRGSLFRLIFEQFN